MLPWPQGRTAGGALSMHRLCPRLPRHEFIPHVAFSPRRSRPADRRAQGNAPAIEEKLNTLINEAIASPTI
ncbi:MAG TPA: hypothetical protein VK777_32155, partial [Reyranella sp.]|nr:hypothetical protein [Reyranella sp.]